MKRLTAIVILLAIASSVLFSGCGSCGNFAMTMGNDLNASNNDYIITLYSASGSVIYKTEVKGRLVEVMDGGQCAFYDNNGKLVKINGTYLVIQK